MKKIAVEIADNPYSYGDLNIRIVSHDKGYDDKINECIKKNKLNCGTIRRIEGV